MWEWRQEITTLRRPTLDADIRRRLSKYHGTSSSLISATTNNPSVEPGRYRSSPWQDNDDGSGNGRRTGISPRYYATVDDEIEWPPELYDYNDRFARTLGVIKRRHDGVVTTVGMPVRSLIRPRPSVISFSDRPLHGRESSARYPRIQAQEAADADRSEPSVVLGSILHVTYRHPDADRPAHRAD